MKNNSDVQFTLKVVIDKQKTKVLFAVVDSDFADTLLSFLTLPLGTIIRILKEHYKDDVAPPVFGSLLTLYEGIDNLEYPQFTSAVCWEMLTTPINSSEFECRQLKLGVDDSPWVDNYGSHLFCYKGEAFTKRGASFVVSDDLRMVPVTGSVLQILADHGIADADGLEFRDVNFGYNEMMDILRELVCSNTNILTSLILNNKHDQQPIVVSQHQVVQEGSTSASKKMSLRVTLRKSTNELLFAQAEDDFVNFLLSFLTLPLGEVVRILENDTGLKSVDSLHRSLTEFTNFGKYLKTSDTLDRLIKPKLPPGYLSENQILPLSKEEYFPCLPDIYNALLQKISRVRGNYVRRLQVYMVTDDLTVAPYCITTAIDILKLMEIPISDVEELELHIRLAEALSLLKASLSSTHALTDGLLSILSL